MRKIIVLGEVRMKPGLLEVMLLGSSIDRLNQVGSGQREEEYYLRVKESFDLRILGYSHSSGPLSDIELPTKSKKKWVQSFLGPLHLIGCKWKPDIIRTKQLWGCWAGWLAKILTGAPLVIRCGYIWSKSFEIERKGRWSKGRSMVGLIERWMIKRGDAFIFSGREVKEFYSSIIGERYSVIIPNTFDIDVFRPDPDAQITFRYIYIGRLVSLKGINEMLELVPENERLLVVGSGPLQDEVARHKGATLISNIPNYELPSYINQAKCFISLSHTEGHPKAAYEAVLCGLYPVLSDIPAHRELVAELGYGALIVAGDILPPLDRLSINEAKLEDFRARYDMAEGLERERQFLMQVIAEFDS